MMKPVFLAILIISFLIAALVFGTLSSKSWNFWKPAPPSKVKLTDIYAYNYLLEMRSAWIDQNAAKPKDEIKSKTPKGAD